MIIGLILVETREPRTNPLFDSLFGPVFKTMLIVELILLQTLIRVGLLGLLLLSSNKIQIRPNGLLVQLITRNHKIAKLPLTLKSHPWQYTSFPNALPRNCYASFPQYFVIALHLEALFLKGIHSNLSTSPC